MTPITRERVEQLARKYEQYPGALRPTLQGEGIHEFAAALLAEAMAPANVPTAAVPLAPAPVAPRITKEEWDNACAGLGGYRA